MHGKSHDRIVLSGILFMYLLALMSVKHLFVGWAKRVLARASTTLSCWLVQRLLMCPFV